MRGMMEAAERLQKFHEESGFAGIARTFFVAGMIKRGCGRRNLERGRERKLPQESGNRES